MTKEKLLVHTCCGVCALNVIEELKKTYDISLYFFNPNIHPQEEYLKRKKYLVNYAEKQNIPVLDDDYSPDKFFELVKGYETCKEGEERCSLCFEMRLENTAFKAKQKGFDSFTTTLTISPHKNSRKIFQTANNISKKSGVFYLEKDFKKNNGFVKTIKMAKELNFYIQNYCGCIYSRDERFAQIRYKKENQVARKTC